MVAEDALDRYVIARLERRIQIIYRVIRVVLNPSRALANAAGARPPWYPPSYDRSLGVTSAR